MRERPIIFSGAMVRAILAGTKTQTRRIVSPRHLEFLALPATEQLANWETRPLPYGARGDRLWVRERFKPVTSGQIKDGYGELRYGFAYEADNATIWQSRPTIIHDGTGKPDTGPLQFKPQPWKPSIHMPRRACRIVLEITDVRVERLRDISCEDCAAEGIEETMPGRYRIYGRESDGRDADSNPRTSFCSLWESINGAGSWDANPWVWAITFKRVEVGRG